MALIKTRPQTAQEKNDAGDEARQLARDLAGLLTRLEDADPSVRRWSVRDLAQHPEAAGDLARHLQRETDRSVREVLLTTLARIGNAEAVAGLVACLRSEDAHLRNEAIDVLKALPQALAPVMGGLLRDADSDVRILAINVLESLQHPDVEQWLIDVIAHDPEVNVCATAVDLLGEVGSPAAEDALQALKRRFAGEPYIEFAADLALQRIRDE